ncbi:hypothetical protein [Streptomyces sp. NBC_00648]|uniref:hypothetical protein n=1 Tax=Streptomyces sp. NBC_00648 TaxID=2975797 RepID=UPI003246286A
MTAALRSLTVGAAAAALPLSLVVPAVPAVAATCNGTYRTTIVAGYEGRYTEYSQAARRPTCSVFTNTSHDGAVLLIRSNDGVVEPNVPSDNTVSQWAVESARQAAQDVVARNATVVLPNESVVLHYSLTNTFTVSMADVRTNAASKLADGIVSYGIKRARAAGLGRIENRINLQANIVACARGASQAWSDAQDSQTLPDLATVLQETEQAVSGPCRTAYDTIKDFDTRAPEPLPEPRVSRPWQETMEWARAFDRPYWQNSLHEVKTVPLGELLLHFYRR